jgi:hypothetical protein
MIFMVNTLLFKGLLIIFLHPPTLFLAKSLLLMYTNYWSDLGSPNTATTSPPIAPEIQSKILECLTKPLRKTHQNIAAIQQRIKSSERIRGKRTKNKTTMEKKFKEPKTVLFLP